MQENHLFEYAVIRVVPRVEREEFVNIGVVLYCRTHRFLQTAFTLPEEKLRVLAADMDIDELKKHIHSFQQIALGKPDSGPIGKLDMPSRFRWLTATRSTILQSSKVHPGLCTDPAKALEKLHAELVL